MCANDDVLLTYGYYFHLLKILNVEDAHATLPSWPLWEQPVTFSCTCSMFFLFNDPQKYFYFTCLRQLVVARLKKEKKIKLQIKKWLIIWLIQKKKKLEEFCSEKYDWNTQSIRTLFITSCTWFKFHGRNNPKFQFV